jgi:hypothetical protein
MIEVSKFTLFLVFSSYNMYWLLCIHSAKQTLTFLEYCKFCFIPQLFIKDTDGLSLVLELSGGVTEDRVGTRRDASRWRTMKILSKMCHQQIFCQFFLATPHFPARYTLIWENLTMLYTLFGKRCCATPSYSSYNNPSPRPNKRQSHEPPLMNHNK